MRDNYLPSTGWRSTVVFNGEVPITIVPWLQGFTTNNNCLIFMSRLKQTELLRRFWYFDDNVEYGCLTRKTVVLDSGTGQRIVRTTCARKKKQELFGIACRDVSFWFGRISKILVENKGFACSFTRISSCRPPQNSASLPASPKTLDSTYVTHKISENKHGCSLIPY